MSHGLQGLKGLYNGVLKSVSNITPTTVRLSFEITRPANEQTQEGFVFKPGQWVDCYIPGVEEIGGYSMTSSPLELPTLELAVKKSKHPPAVAAHQAEVGDLWSFRVGGSFFLNENDRTDKLFVAGGVGINPLYSMIKHISLIRPQCSERIILLYSAPSSEELAYHSELSDLHSRMQNFSYIPNLTKEKNASLHTGRINEGKLKEQLDAFESIPNCYICGPPEMTDNVIEMLQSIQIGKENIFYEKWW